MQEPQRNIVFRNLANIVSLLGVLPLCILFGEHGYQYLLPLIIFNNIMDDLDGVLAAKLNIRSDFGALLDNVCDAISHTIIMMVVGMHYFQEAGAHEAGPFSLGAACLATSLLAIAAIIMRSVARIAPAESTGTGSPTNELIRHVFFVLLLTQIVPFDPTPYLIVACLLHAVSMHVPFKMPYLIRSLTKSPVAIGMVNVALIVAWLVPAATPVVAASFVVTYLVSFATGGFRWRRKADASNCESATGA